MDLGMDLPQVLMMVITATQQVPCDAALLRGRIRT